ncbi:ATP synthase mitochondrial F1 complex assembly factor 1-like [Schistocerca gregaria]|uniref:ATP synthase mitochondrial F1 complex assembly factor 1-like n=1 Tax=Schistocerca gregaria TaxID=7010 RepID=UPI00211DC437|nr:ATP synthase mitochondrial F1 complex assembly factor 1-like [Schistocerca gregaria]
MVMKLDLVRCETAERIREIWQTYHKSKFCIASSIDADQFAPVHQIVSKFPSYVVPLVRSSQGAEFFYFRQDGNYWLFYRLAEVQLRREEAAPALKVVYYFDFFDDKKLVLMRGEIDPVALTMIESQFLLNQVQVCYLDPRRLQSVVSFNRNPEKFNWNELLDDIGMSAEKK